MSKNKKLKINHIKEFLLSKGFIVIKKKKISFFTKELRSLYLTTLYSFAIIIFSFSLPTIIEFKKILLLLQMKLKTILKVILKEFWRGKL